METLDRKQFNYLAWLTGVCAVVYLAGAVFALVTKLITFADFAAAVAIPLGPLVGWAARGAGAAK